MVCRPAGLQTIISLRQGGYDGDITLIGDEAFLPYQRPPLSKAYLSGKMERERLFLKPEEFFTDNNVTLKLETSVDSLNAAEKTGSLNNGETLSYDYAVFATGSRPRWASPKFCRMAGTICWIGGDWDVCPARKPTAELLWLLWARPPR